VWDFDKYSNNIALISENNLFTYKNLLDFTKELNSKKKLRSLILFICDNSLSSYLGYISFLFNNDVQIIIDENNKNNYHDIIRKYKPNYIWCRKKISLEMKVELISKFNFNNYNLYELNNKNVKLHKELLLLCTSSGTTGNPKFIKQSQKNIFSNTKSIIKYQNLNNSYTSITTLPLSYTFGMSCINTLLTVGAKIVISNHSLLQKEFWQIFKKHEITILNGVPFTYNILEKLKFFNKPNNIKIFTQAGGKLSDYMQLKISKFCRNNKSKFFIMYGQAEATTRISYLPSKYSIKKIGSAGIPVDGGKIKILNNNLKLIRKKNIVGDIHYNGPNVCMGYSFAQNDLKKNYEWKNGIITGDIGKIDEENFLYITGRKKRFAKLYGLSINLDDIEKIILQSYDNIDVASISEKDKIIVFYNKKILKLKILKLLSNKININQKSFELFFIKKISKLNNGKTDYQDLKSRYLS
tara:strand:+ start:3477 stop:4880 length:1404 start_codon:yes stop_codon:yes gene_type:complete